jgi:hypothetical protein
MLGWMPSDDTKLTWLHHTCPVTRSSSRYFRKSQNMDRKEKEQVDERSLSFIIVDMICDNPSKQSHANHFEYNNMKETPYATKMKKKLNPFIR